MITCIKFSSALRIRSGNWEGMESSTVRVERFEKSILMVHSAVGRIHSWLFFFYLVTLWVVLATFRLQCEDHYEYKFSELNTRCRFGGRNISKCACSQLIGPSRSRPHSPIWRSLLTNKNRPIVNGALKSPKVTTFLQTGLIQYWDQSTILLT